MDITVHQQLIVYQQPMIISVDMFDNFCLKSQYHKIFIYSQYLIDNIFIYSGDIDKQIAAVVKKWFDDFK